MYNPHLVESQIKNITSYNLQQCHKIKTHYYNIIFNLLCFCFIIALLWIILYYKYRNNTNIKEKEIKENKKRDYILYNLRKFQNIKNKYITNIPFN